jgi:hypothetical protein
MSLAASLILVCSPIRAQNIEITLEGGKQDLKNVPVCVPLNLTSEQADRTNAEKPPAIATGKFRGVQGQLTAPGIMTMSIAPASKGLVRRDLHFILPEIKAGEKLALSWAIEGTAPAGIEFQWEQNKDRSTTLTLAEQPVLRYMNAPYDNSTPQKRDRTYKVFHHLYDPTGKRLVTNGGQTDAYTDEKKLLYPHHRGLMYAFNKISYGEGLKKTADTWHAKPGDTHQQHDRLLSEEAGPVLGRHRVLVNWYGPKNDVFGVEERELTVYNARGGTLVEFASRLKTTGGKVRLDGDPQHAGFQFRAANEVAEKTAKQTYYLRPDGKGKLDETRNWDPKTKEGPVNLPWDAMCFILGGQRYTVCYLSNPSNPKESRFSERDYGRFGCYFEYDLTEDHPLIVNYRVWLQDGETTGEQVEALYQAFAHPPRVAVRK